MKVSFNAFSANHREPERCFSFTTISMSCVRRVLYQIEDGLPENRMWVSAEQVFKGATLRGYCCLRSILGSYYLSGKLPTYPSPKPTLILTSHLRENVGLGEGQVGSFPER